MITLVLSSSTPASSGRLQVSHSFQPPAGRLFPRPSAPVPVCRQSAAGRASSTLSRPPKPHSDDTCPSLQRIPTFHISRQRKEPHRWAAIPPAGLAPICRQLAAGGVSSILRGSTPLHSDDTCPSLQRIAISRQRKEPHSWQAIPPAGSAPSSRNQLHSKHPAHQGLCSASLDHHYRPAAVSSTRAGVNCPALTTTGQIVTTSRAPDH
jgi:hypothetical protein